MANQQNNQQHNADVAQLINVGLRYGTQSEALRGISLRLQEQSFQFVCGHSGAGKSSLLKLLYLAHPPSTGIMTIFGNRVDELRREDLPSLRHQIGVVFQDFRLIDHYTTYENVELPLKVQGVDTSRIRSKVHELLQWVGLGDYLHVCPPMLSGGQQQRVAIARAVVTRPRLLLADEPTGNVDDNVATRVFYLLEELYRQGTAVVVASHNMDLVKQMNKPIIWLKRGRLSSIDGHHHPNAPQSQWLYVG